ncbi:MAG: LamG-like jellyroll fold domain-containing protein, partial [Candidatus Methylomirabilota bacterium]
TPATAHSYTVAACDAAGNCSAQSSPAVSVTTPAGGAATLPTPAASLLGGAGGQRGTGLAIAGGSLYASGVVGAESQTAGDTSLLARYPLPLTAEPVWSRTIQNGTVLYGVAATIEGVHPAGWNYSLSSDTAGGKEVKSYLASYLPDGTVGSAADGAAWVATPNLFNYGGVEWFRTALPLVVDGIPYVFAAGFGQPCSWGAYTVAKFDAATGVRLAAVTDSSVGVSLDVCSTPSNGGSGAYGLAGLNGNLYVAGYSSWPHEGDSPGVPALYKYDTNLTLLWRQKATGIPGAFNGVTAFQGAIYAAGYTGTTAGTEDFLIRKYAEDGSLVWSRTSGGAGADVLTGIVGIGPRLFAVGHTASSGAGGKDMAVLEIDPATGDTLSTALYGGALDDQANGAATDGTDLYVIGEAKSFASVAGNAAGQSDMALLRYALPVTMHTLTAARNIEGGTVTSMPAGIDCPGDCTESYPHGTLVTLTSHPDPTHVSGGWDPPCGADIATCTVTMDAAKTVTALFGPGPTAFNLLVGKTGTGSGTVATGLGDIDCGTLCAGVYGRDVSVTLHATAAAGSTFAGWGGDCSGTGPCTLTMSGTRNVTATFTLVAGLVAADPYASDTGTILLDHLDGSTSASLLAYQELGAACDWTAKPAATPNAVYTSGPSGLGQGLSLYPPIEQPTGSKTYLQYPGGQLLSQPNGTLEFWTYLTSYESAISVAQGPYHGACAGWTFSLGVSQTGQLQAGAWAAFDLNSGAVAMPLNTWTHVAVTWGSAGAKLYLNGEVVGTDPNTGSPAPGYGGSVLVNSGTGSGGATIDELRISSVQRTSFNLVPPGQTLTVATAGAGSGTVTSVPAGIECGATCASPFAAGSSITLTATPDANATFAGWSGCDSTAGSSCTVVMTAAKAVTATFDSQPTEGTYVLTVTTQGESGGSIVSAPAGVVCAPICAASFAGGSSITLTATPASGATFTGWSGACSNATGDCTVVMSQDQAVTATFTPAVSFPAPAATLIGGVGDQRGTALAVAGESLYVTGGAAASQTADDSSLLLKFALPLSGAPAWSRTIQSGTALFGVAASLSEAYPVGWSYSLSNDPSGDKEVKSYGATFRADGIAGSAADGAAWVATPNLFSYGGVEYLNAATAVTVGGTPYIFAAGFGQPCSYGAYTVVKLDPATGARLAAATDSSVGISLDMCSIPSVGGSGAQGISALNGSLYVAGYSAWASEGDTLGVPALWKYDPSSLTLLWRQKASDAPGGAFSAVTAFQGAVYAAGYVRLGAAGTEEFLIRKYAEDGSLVWSRISGGAGSDVLTGIVGIGTRLFAVGYTTSYGAGGKDMVALEIDPATGDTRTMTLYGGVQDDLASGAATDGTDLYVIGEAKSFDSAAGNAVGQNDIVLLRYPLPASGYTLTMTPAGTGVGTVTSAPGGITCGVACTTTFPVGGPVVLTASPAIGSTFVGWSGCDSTDGNICTVSMTAARAVTATFDLVPATYTLTVATAGSGTGTVGADPAGSSFAAGTSVTLTAAPGAGSTFAGWSGACTSTSGVCTVIMDGDKSVTATFTIAAGTVSVPPYVGDASTILLDHFDAGTSASILAFKETGVQCWEMEPAATPSYVYGSGPAGLSQALSLSPPTGEPAGSQTYLQYPGGQLLSQPSGTLEFWAYLTSYASALSISQGPYPGACSGWTFGLSINAAGQLSAGAWAAFSLNSGAAIVPLNAWTHVAASWGSAGAKLYLNGTLVGSDPNTGMPASGYGGSVLVFSAVESGGAMIDELRISNVQRTSFNLQPPGQTLTVTKQGTGTVVSAPAGIDCGATCSATFPPGTSVTLTATPDAGSIFAGWSGACSGTATCAVTMDAGKNVTATFTLPTITLALTKEGTGAGSVTSTPTGISCGPTCSASFAANTVVTLTATPDATSTFAGWSGACVGTGTCQVTLAAAQSLTATFTRNTYLLTVSTTGSGGGTVTSNVGGISSCGATCTANYPGWTSLTLTATPDPTSLVTGWTGCDSASGHTCTVTMTSAKAVTVLFDRQPLPLTVQKAGLGSGTVTATPAGISCGSTCAAGYAPGTALTLTATPAPGSTFTGWSGGGCSGTGLCPLTLTQATTLTATFAPGATAPPTGELPVDAHTLSLYHFNELAGEVATDSGPLANHATALGGASVAPGRFGAARALDGVAGFLTAPHQAAFAVLPQLTLEAWVQPTGFDLACGAQTETLVGSGTTVNGQFAGYALTITRNTDDPCGSATSLRSVRLAFTLGGPATATSREHPSTTWLYVAGTYDGTYARLYVNGLLEGISLPTPGVATTSAPLTVGAHTWETNGIPGASQRLAGLLDEVRLSTLARSAAELQAAYRAVTTPPGPLELGSPVAVGSAPQALALAPDQTVLYLLRGGEPATVTPLDPTTLQPTGAPRPLLTGAGSALALAPDGQALYALGTPLQQLPLPAGEGIPLGTAASPGHSLAVNALGTRAYVSHPTDGTVSVVDLTTQTPLPPLDFGGGAQPTTLVLSPDGTRLYVATGPGTLAVVDTPTSTLLAPVALASTEASPALAIHPSGGELYLAAGATVLALDTTTRDGGSAVPL